MDLIEEEFLTPEDIMALGAEFVKDSFIQLVSKNENYAVDIEWLLDIVPPEEFLAALPVEKRLAGLSPEQRMAGLSPRERLAGLGTEELRILMKEIEQHLHMQSNTEETAQEEPKSEK